MARPLDPSGLILSKRAFFLILQYLILMIALGLGFSWLIFFEAGFFPYSSVSNFDWVFIVRILPILLPQTMIDLKISKFKTQHLRNTTS